MTRTTKEGELVGNLYDNMEDDSIVVVLPARGSPAHNSIPPSNVPQHITAHTHTPSQLPPSTPPSVAGGGSTIRGGTDCTSFSTTR